MAEVDPQDLSVYDQDVVEHGLCGAARSRMLLELTDGKPWQVQLDEGSIVFGSERFKVQILGTHSGRDDTFLWAWANPGAAQWGPSVNAANALRARGEKPGSAVFRERKIAGQWVHFRELAWVSGELAKAGTVHFADAGGGTTAVMLVEGGSTDLAQFPLVFLPGVLLEFQGASMVPVRACLLRFLERLKFTVEQEKSSVRARRADGNTMTIDFDAQGRITNVQLKAVAP